MKLKYVALLIACLLAAEFLLHKQISFVLKRIASEFGLLQFAQKPLVVLPEGAVQSNEFAFVFESLTSLPVKTTAAGVRGVPGQPGFWIAEQASATLGPYQLEPFLTQNGFSIPTAFDGGIRKIVAVGDQMFALGAFNDGACYFAALIDLDQMTLVERFPCLPDGTVELNFKGIGGGFATHGSQLYLAVGPGSDVNPSRKNDLAQDATSPYGKILRYDIRKDAGNITLQNRQIFSSGHRNPQGILVMGDMVLAVEHGPMGGDEINLIAQGNNYGWPIYSAGSGYDNADLPSFATPGSGFTNPIFSFVPSIGISDISACPTIIRNKKGGTADCLIISALKDESIYIVLGNMAAKQVYSVERIPVGARVREVILIEDTMYLVPDFSNIIRVQIQAL